MLFTIVKRAARAVSALSKWLTRKRQTRLLHNLTVRNMTAEIWSSMKLVPAKIVAAAADRFIVIVSANKVVDRLRPPVPLELLEFGIDSTLRRLGALGPVQRRSVPRSPDGGVIADLLAPVEDADALAAELDGVAGVVAHGLFPPVLVSQVIVGRDGEASAS